MFLSHNSIYPIGLDISDSSLKLVQLDKKGNKIKIQAIGKTELPEGYFMNGEIVKKDDVVRAIKKLIEKPQYGKVSSDEVVACLPETKTFLKFAKIEKSPNDITHLIEAELEKNIPMTINELYYDWQIVKNTRDAQLVLIAAAPRKIVDQYSKIIEDAGLTLVAFEIEPVASCRGLLEEESTKYKGGYETNYFIIDIGAARTNLLSYSKNTILFSITIDLSGNDITDEIARTLEIDLEQAEKAKIICGLDEDKAQGVVKNILGKMMDKLTAKILEAQEYQKTHFGERGGVDKIYLCGGGANIKNLPEIIAEKTKVSTTIGNPIINLSGSREEFIKIIHEVWEPGSAKKSKKSKPPTLTQDTPSTFATAIGLGLRNIFLEE